MKTIATFYHAGCLVCLEAEALLVRHLNADTINLSIVHLGNERARMAEAEASGVKSVPALVVDGHVLHLNFGAALADLK